MKVLPGQEIGQTGKDGPRTYREGEVFEVPDHQVNEFRYKAVPSDEAGAEIAQPSNLDADLSTSQPHERISLLEAERDRLQASLDALNQRIEQERQNVPTQETKPPTNSPAPTPDNTLKTTPMQPGAGPAPQGAAAHTHAPLPSKPVPQEGQTPNQPAGPAKADVISQ